MLKRPSCFKKNDMMRDGWDGWWDEMVDWWDERL